MHTRIGSSFFFGTLFFFFGLHLGQADSPIPPTTFLHFPPRFMIILHTCKWFKEITTPALKITADGGTITVSGKLQSTADTKAACEIFTQLSEKPEFPSIF